MDFARAESTSRRYLDLILEANKRTNLTRITSREEAEVLHLEDSWVGLPEINRAPDGRYGDLGSGGGFPGVPIALATGRETVLVDSVKKKMAIVDSVLDELGIGEQVSTYRGRIEELALSQPQSFSVLTARALARLGALLELASPLLVKGGVLVCYKAQLSEEELKEARCVESMLGMRLISTREVMLSDGETKRTIVAFEKVGKSLVKLPRRIGAAQRNPLKPQK